MVMKVVVVVVRVLLLVLVGGASGGGGGGDVVVVVVVVCGAVGGRRGVDVVVRVEAGAVAERDDVRTADGAGESAGGVRGMVVCFCTGGLVFIETACWGNVNAPIAVLCG